MTRVGSQRHSTKKYLFFTIAYNIQYCNMLYRFVAYEQ